MSQVRFYINTLNLAANRVRDARTHVDFVKTNGMQDSMLMVRAVQSLNIALGFEKVARSKVVNQAMEPVAV